MSANDLAEVKILDILKRYSDFDHPLSKKDVRHYLKSDYDLDTDNKTISRILENLTEYTDNRVSYKTDKKRLKRNPVTKELQPEKIITDFYYEAPFTNEELRFLIDTVNFAAHLPVSYRKEICGKLEKLGNKYFRRREVLMEKRPNRDNPALFDTLGQLDDAIRLDCKVQLKYLEYDAEKDQMVPRRDKDGNEREYIISPYEFALSGGHYYIICSHDHHDTLSHYRLDRMKDVKVLDRPRKRLGKNSASGLELESEMRKYCEQHAFMYSGEVILAKLRINKDPLNGIKDTFGEAARITPDGDMYLVDIKATEASLIHLVKAYAPNIEVLDPSALRSAMREVWVEALAVYTDAPETEP